MSSQKDTEHEALMRVLKENNDILKENNKLMKEIKEMLRKIAINTSS
jgi:hypothetical protein